LKSRRAHLAHKAEHAVDVGSELVAAAPVYRADQSDPPTLLDSTWAAQVNVALAGSEQEIEGAVADKGHPKAQALAGCAACNTRTYVPEPKGRHYRSGTLSQQRRAVRANRRRIKRAKGKRLQKRRGEVVGRSFAHICETGGARRTWPRGIEEVAKRYAAQVAAHNLASLVRKLFGLGKPPALQGRSGGLVGRACWLYWLSAALQRCRGRRVVIRSRAATT
jgi:hypothetical protein